MVILPKNPNLSSNPETAPGAWQVELAMGETGSSDDSRIDQTNRFFVSYLAVIPGSLRYAHGHAARLCEIPHMGCRALCEKPHIC
jgi:hypothetical protein